MVSKIDKLFGSKTRVKLLCKLLLGPKKSYYLRELARELGVSYGALYREVENLADIGVVKRERVGKVTLLSVNERLPYIRDLRALLVKTAGVADVLKETLEKFPAVKYAVIYGSFASGEATEESDVDVLIVGSLSEEELARELARAEEELGREVNYILWSEEEFAKRAREGHHLLTEVAARPIIVLVGDEVEFRRAVERRARSRGETKSRFGPESA
jgi:predicted nucleotidyltransferase